MNEAEFDAEAMFLERLGLVEDWANLMLGEEAPLLLIGAAMRIWEARHGKDAAIAMARGAMAGLLAAEGKPTEFH